MNELIIKMYKIIRKKKKMNLPILSKNRSNPVVKIPKHIINKSFGVKNYSIVRKYNNLRTIE